MYFTGCLRINHRRCNYEQIGIKCTSNSLKRRVAKKEKISYFGCYKVSIRGRAYFVDSGGGLTFVAKKRC